jgi:hypothetical protein
MKRPGATMITIVDVRGARRRASRRRPTSVPKPTRVGEFKTGCASLPELRSSSILCLAAAGKNGKGKELRRLSLRADERPLPTTIFLTIRWAASNF